MDKDLSRGIFNKRKKAADKKQARKDRFERAYEKGYRGNV